MALEATHMRFAFDLQKKYQIKDTEKYIAGTIYPDSRYFTGIDRTLTHPSDYAGWNWEEADDFKRGWLAHLLVDKTQWQIIQEELPDIFTGDYSRHDREIWVKHTAIKILQDIEDAKKFNIKLYLPYLEFSANPNGEDIEMVKKSNKVISKLYAEPDKLNINSYHEFWECFGIGSELTKKLIIQAERYQNDKKIMSVINNLYQKALDRINNQY
jgi:hypothetical protein